MMDGQHQKGPAPDALSHHSDKAGIGWAVVVVVDAACDWHPVVAALPGGGSSYDVAKLWAVERWMPRHLTDIKKKVRQRELERVYFDKVRQGIKDVEVKGSCVCS